MSAEEVPIVEVRANGPVVKDPHHKHQKWAAAVVYVLDDGRMVESWARAKTKRDLVAYVSSLPAPPPRPTAAAFDEDGEFWGTRTVFKVGG